MKPVSVIGMGLSPDDLTVRHWNLIDRADIIVGGTRILNFFMDCRAEKKEIKSSIIETIRYIKGMMNDKSIVVLASGDPLFFGIGSLLIKQIGHKNVEIYPNITTVAAAFARIKEPWHDVFVVSLHGRNNEKALIDAAAKNDKIAVFTDNKNTPASIAKLLIQNNITNFEMCVFEQLGIKDERACWHTCCQARTMQFKEPNIVVLKRIFCLSEKKQRNLSLGTSDSWFEHEKGLITKSEVRVLSLAALSLESSHILWDLGGGSGSVAIEASLFIKKEKIYIVEQKADRVKQIKNNINTFGVENVEVIHATLPDSLADLPEPDRIFIGGGGKDLEEIIKSSLFFLKDKGVIVINTVLLSSINTAMDILKKNGYETDIIQVQINRGKDMPWGKRLASQNPVWIITGKK